MYGEFNGEAMAKADIKAGVEELLRTYLDQNGLDLYKIEYKKEGPVWVLRVFLDKPADADSEYVSIDECEAAAGYLSDRLDESGLIERQYNLEVSSPGLDRELIKDSDYVRFAGRPVEVRTYEQINGSRDHEGVLIGRSGGTVTIETGSGELAIPAEKISRINLAVVF